MPDVFPVRVGRIKMPIPRKPDVAGSHLSQVPCFTLGTVIATPTGEVPIQNIAIGDRVITRDNGVQKVAWVGKKEITGAQMTKSHHLKPVMIKAGALGNGLPERDMMVSPNHRMLVSSKLTQLYFEENEVLAPAKHMIGAAGIQIIDAIRLTYFHFMFEGHQAVLANGTWTESFHANDFSLKAVGNSQRNEIFELFPELSTEKGLRDYEAVRRVLSRRETTKIFH